MNSKLLTMIVIAVAVVASFAGPKVFGQAQSTGRWQMVAGSGGEGATAWKFNVDTGQSFFCYRQNCFASVMASPAIVRQ